MRYDYQCEKCGEIFEDVKSVAKRHTSICPVCGGRAKKLFSFQAAIRKTFDPYIDPHISPDGNPILVESREQKRRLLKQQGLEWVPSVRWI